MEINLSKSAFIKGLICHKALFYSRFHPELAEDVSPAKQHLFDVGHEVEAAARALFPGGKDVSEDTITTAQVIQNTEIALALDCKVLYQASFSSSGGYCRTDIFVNDEEKALYEVKSTTKISIIHLLDVAFQYYILKEAGYKPDKVFIIYINNEYVMGKELNPRELFKIEDVHEDVLKLIEDIPSGIQQMKEMLENVQPPDKAHIGLQCDDPYPCDFKKHCWQHIPANSIFDIARMTRKKKFELYDAGILHLADIPPNTKLNENQKMQVELTLEKGFKIDKEKIRNFVSKIKYPIYFLDFETVQSAIPRYKGTKPYQQIPFQYSLHIQQEDGNVTHLEFLADPLKDFRLTFLKKLLKETEGRGTILAYNKSFEVGRLKELAKQYPKYEEEIFDRVIRVIDLMEPFRDRLFYHHEFKGSYSIKNILPVLVPELSYKELYIREGVMASITFDQLPTLDKADAKMKREQLLAYCKLDTWAMVCILKVIKTI